MSYSKTVKIENIFLRMNTAYKKQGSIFQLIIHLCLLSIDWVLCEYAATDPKQQL
jgi:hypothetical protein